MRCVIPMLAPSDRMSLGAGLSLLADALREKDSLKVADAASLFELLCDRGYVSKRHESVLRAMSAFAFEAAGESPRSKRSYNKLFGMILPLEDVLGSKELSKLLTQAIVNYGLRNLDGFRILAEQLFEELNKRESLSIYIPEESIKPDYIISLSIVDLLLSYCEALQRIKGLPPLALKIESLNDMVETESLSSWLAILARLVCYMLTSVIERSILNLSLSRHTELKLIKKSITELWAPQADAIKKGLLSGNNIVYSTGTATGKSLLAYLLAGTASPEKKVIYIVPTRTLASEAYKTISDFVDSNQTPVVISTREMTESDEKLSEKAIIVATYEKFDSLLRQNRISESSIKCVIADEVHFISSRDRGIPLEFTLVEMKSRIGAADPQIVALSAMISAKDADLLSSWLGASKVRSEWKPVKLDEMIFFGGHLYHKEGAVEALPQIKFASDKEPKLAQRTFIAKQLAKDALLKEGQCMIIVGSRADAEKIAEEISAYLEEDKSFDIDFSTLLSIGEARRVGLAQEIQRSEPILPICAKKLGALIKNGVAYHHAGLPAKYREIIEAAVADQFVKVLVTTTTFEVGVNLPISTAIFLQVNTARIPVRTYRNLAGRAGRPKFDVKGESIIIALTKDEMEKIRDLYFLSEEEPLESGLRYFIRNVPAARYAVQSEILEKASEHECIDVQDLMNHLKQSWFWARADDQKKTEFTSHINTEIRKLGVFGFVKRFGDTISVTAPGKAASKVMLSPFSMKNLTDNARRVFKANQGGKSLEILILSLVGIPHEVEDNDTIINHAKIASECDFVSKVLSQDRALYEKLYRIPLCAKYATVLWYWIKSIPTEEILKLSDLDPSSDAALLEETLPNDAFWVLSTLASVPNSVIEMTQEQRALVFRLAMDCKYGSSDPVVHELLALGLKHIGRETAIAIAKYAREKNKDFKRLSESDLLELFQTNAESARLLFAELREKLTLAR